MQELHRAPPPPSNGYVPYRILAVCRINLWPAVRMELGQEGRLKQPVAKVRGSTMPVIRDHIRVTTVVLGVHTAR
jgi:hypothetical protein